MIRNVSELKAKNKASGRKFFSRGAMRFFRSKVEAVYPRWYGCLFVTSEQYNDASPRLFTVHREYDNGETETCSEFQQFETLSDARSFALGHIAELVDPEAIAL